MSALYQKYRPKSFSDLVNQNHIKITIQNQISRKKTAHAYLFCGPRAVGKTTTARLLAKALNCVRRKEGESEPCNDCDSCKEIDRDRSLDIIEIDAASHTGVDNVRENIIASARVAASHSNYKVFIIDEVHMLSISAFNALLKTLEEPPKKVVFILATTEIHKVPQTIISRCQRFDFKKISNNEMLDRLKLLVKLEGKQVDDDVLQSIVREVGGYVRDAESLLDQVLSLDAKHITSQQAQIIIPPSNFNLIAELTQYLLSKDKVRALHLVNTLTEEGVDLVPFTKNLILFLRKLLFAAISDSLDAFSVDFGQEVEELIIEIKKESSASDLVEILDIIIVRSKELETAQIRQLPLELAIIELSKEGGINNQPLAKNMSATQISVVDKVENVVFSTKIAELTKTALDKKIDTLTTANPVKINITIEQILEKWPQFIEHLKKKETAISFMLAAAVPQELQGNVLQIGFKHKFHCESIQNNGKQDKLEEILKEVFNTNLRVVCVFDLTVKVNPANGRISDIAKGSANKPVIFHIQDLHTQLQAQSNAAKIMEDLVREYGSNLILLEGGATTNDFAYLREIVPLEVRKQKAQELLEQGIIDGQNVLDIGTDLPLSVPSDKLHMYDSLSGKRIE